MLGAVAGGVLIEMSLPQVRVTYAIFTDSVTDFSTSGNLLDVLEVNYLFT